MSTPAQLTTARNRIAECFRYGRDHLNLSGLGLTDEELAQPIDIDGEPIFFFQLSALRYLDLTGNQLTKLPEGFELLSDLAWLGLNFNRLASLEGIGLKANLQRLYLRGNPLNELSEDVGRFKALIELDLTGCGLASLPTSMGHLSRLKTVTLDEDRLAPDLRAAWDDGKWQSLRQHLLRADAEAFTRFQASGQLHSAIERLAGDNRDFKDKMVAAVPGIHSMSEWRELLAGQIAREIGVAMEALQSRRQDRRFLGKLVLVGNQDNGKTSLQRALRGLPHIPGHPSTPGMTRVQMHLRLDGTLVPIETRKAMAEVEPDVIDLQVWDMGGQTHYQHTHQLFFTPGAIYLAVMMPREGGTLDDLKRWLELIRRRTGGKATVILVSTSCTTKPPDKALKLEDLQAEFPGMIKHLLPVDSATDTGIQELRDLIGTMIGEQADLFGHRWLQGWAESIDELAQREEPYLAWSDVAGICAKHGVDEPEMQRRLVRTAHLIGSLLWREDTPASEEVVVLNPDWLNSAVARLLDDDISKEQHGLVRISELPKVWTGVDREGKPGYPPNTHQMLIHLMEINELAYRPKVPGSAIGDGDLLLVTQCVAGQPRKKVGDEWLPLDLEAEWQRITPQNCKEACRIIGFADPDSNAFGAVPDLIYLLIHRLRDFSLGRDDFHEAVHWQTGLLVRDEHGSVGRIELRGHELHLRVRYRLTPGLLDSISHRIGAKKDGMWNGLMKKEFVPCGEACAMTPPAPDQGRFALEHCDKAVAAGQSAVVCGLNKCANYVRIDALFAGAAVAPDALQLLEKFLPAAEVEMAANRKFRTDVLAQFGDLKRIVGDLRDLVEMQQTSMIELFGHRAKDGPRLFSIKPAEPAQLKLKNWTHVDMEVTVWCEKCRRPVPFLTDGRQGTEIVPFPRAWLRWSKRLLKMGMWTAIAIKTGGAIGVGSAVGSVVPTGSTDALRDAAKAAESFAEPWEAYKETEQAIDDERHDDLDSRGSVRTSRYGSLSGAGIELFGQPMPEELSFLGDLRKAYEQKEEENRVPKWGGLQMRDDDKFGVLWVHPNCHAVRS